MAHPTDAELAFAAVSPRVPPDSECDTMTADQQIRAKALECVAIATSGELTLNEVREVLPDIADRFFTYIREGK